MGDIAVEKFGDKKVYTLRRGLLEMRVTDWGATVMSLKVPDKTGCIADVVLGFDTIDPYMDGTSSPFFGAVVGRVANRIGGASFTLNGESYHTPANDGTNTLHGGDIGFDKVHWQSRELEDERGPSVQFTYNSFDGEQGFPGHLEVAVVYTLCADLEVRVEMEAKPINKATPVSLANHSYWNLSGHGNGDILDHKVRIWASRITPVDDSFIATGEIASVLGTPFDFLEEASIGSRIDQVQGPTPGGYDHNYVLDKGDEGDVDGVRKAARVLDPATGRVLEVFTNAPGMQFYSGNFLEHIVGKGGAVYNKHSGLCLETQGFPNAVNQKEFPTVVVQPGNVYKHTIVYRFSIVT